MLRRTRRLPRLACLLSLVAAAQAQEVKPPEFVAVRVGFADRYKVGLWTPIEVTLRGGSSRRDRPRPRQPDRQRRPELLVRRAGAVPGASRTGNHASLLYVRFGHEASTLSLELLDGQHDACRENLQFHRSRPRTTNSPTRSAPDNGSSFRWEEALPGWKRPCRARKAKRPQNVVAAVDSLARLPTRWQGYEGVDIVVISTSKPEVFAKISPQNARIEALEQWVRMGGTLVLCAGSHAEEALHAGSPLAKFVPGRFEKTVLLRQTSGWETYAKSVNPIPPPKPGEKVELPTPRLADVQGKIEAREADLPLVIRKPQGLGQVVFVATDLDRGPIRDWSDRSLLVAAILNLPANEQAGATDRAGAELRLQRPGRTVAERLDLPRDVHLVPFFVVALLVIVYILLIGPGDYFLLRRLGRGMQWTWITFPAIVVLFAVGAYLAAYWLKGDQLRVSQVDLVDIDAEGTARGASWFSIFSPRGESFDLSMRPRLPDGQTAAGDQRVAGLAGQGGQRIQRHVQPRHAELGAALEPGLLDRLRRWTRSAACRSRSGPPRVSRNAGWDARPIWGWTPRSRTTRGSFPARSPTG